MSSPLRKSNTNNRYGMPVETDHSYYDYIQTNPQRRRKIKRKKVSSNFFIKFICTVIALLCLGGYAYYICPYNYEKYFEPLILNRILNYNTKLKTKDFVFETRPYLYNSLFLDEKMLVSAAEKTKEITDIKIISEMTNTKNEILNLAKNYTKIEPSVFVWEYSTGAGFEINSDKIYPSASIIKIPIALELIKLVDETSKTINPISLTDKRVFTEQYRTLGSGDLQYSKGNVPYTLDYLANIMISESDNSATNMLLAEIGGINSFNRSMRKLGLKTTRINEWLPDLEGTNKTTAREISTLLYNIDNPNFINPKYKNVIKEYLGNTKNIHLLKEKLPQGVMVLHKTGDIGTMLGDSGIIYTNNGKKYIVTILAKRNFNDYGAKTFIQDASLIIYNSIKNL